MLKTKILPEIELTLGCLAAVELTNFTVTGSRL
jgi:hypothetical protein